MNITSYKKSKKNTIFGKVGVFSASLLVAASAVYLYSPVISSHAEEDRVETEVGAFINSVASLTLDVNSLNFAITPTAAGTFESKPVVATVSTNSTDGYELYFSSVDNDTDMVNSSVSNVIASDFSGTVTSSTMASNKWGYSLDDTDFSAIPALNFQIALRNLDHYPTAQELTTTVNIGMKIDDTLPSGRYSKSVVFSVLAHETQMPRLTMQGFSCSTLPNIGDTVELVDIRDGKEYRVRKLADGKCWMIDNLAISDKTLTSEDSDLVNDFTLPVSSTAGLHSRTSAAAYIDPVYGGYYNFHTATAGEDVSQIDEEYTAEHSICPKGWKIPHGGAHDWDEDYIENEFEELYVAVGEDFDALLDPDGPNFALSGAAGSNGLDSDGTAAFYWTATSATSLDAWYFFMGMSDWDDDGIYEDKYVYPDGGDSLTKIDGFAIRCIARN